MSGTEELKREVSIDFSRHFGPLNPFANKYNTTPQSSSNSNLYPSHSQTYIPILRLKTPFPFLCIINKSLHLHIFMETQMNDVKYEEEYVVNSRGVKLFTCRWVPANNEEPKALIFLCHGYAMECSISMRGCAGRLVKAGYEVHGIDCEGHGKSSGLQGLIPNFDDLVDDLSEHFTNISGQ